MDKAQGNSSGGIVEIFIKPRASTIFGHPEYSLDGPGLSIAVLGPHEEFFSSDFGIWIGGNNFSDGCCRPIRMQEVCRALGLKHNGLVHLPSLKKEVDMIPARVMPIKCVISSLMISLKEVEIKVEHITLHIHHKRTSKTNLKDKGEIPTVMVHKVQINETTTLPLTT